MDGRKELGKQSEGEEVRVSTPLNTASSAANPFIFLSKTGIASRKASVTKDGKQFFNSPNDEFSKEQGKGAQKMDERKELGKHSEQLARQYLERRGYRLGGGQIFCRWGG